MEYLQRNLWTFVSSEEERMYLQWREKLQRKERISQVVQKTPLSNSRWLVYLGELVNLLKDMWHRLPSSIKNML